MIISNKIWISAIIEGLWNTLLLIILITTISYLSNEYFLKEYFELPAIIPSVLGTALAFFIGFNNNQAYDRWWEARKIWGALVNDSRTWVRQVLNYTSHSTDISEKELSIDRVRMVHRHIAFLYALKENLRGSGEKEYQKFLTVNDLNAVESKSNKYNAILNLQSEDLKKMKSNGAVDGYEFLEINKSLIAFSDEMGMSERIKNTVFPTIYIHYTSLFIWVLIVCITIVTESLVGPWSIIMGMLIGMVYVITHKIGLLLLNPFDEIKTGIPLNQITRTIEINLLETLDEENIPEPVKSVDNKYVM